MKLIMTLLLIFAAIFSVSIARGEILEIETKEEVQKNLEWLDEWVGKDSLPISIFYELVGLDFDFNEKELLLASDLIFENIDTKLVNIHLFDNNEALYYYNDSKTLILRDYAVLVITIKPTQSGINEFYLGGEKYIFKASIDKKYIFYWFYNIDKSLFSPYSSITVEYGNVSDTAYMFNFKE